MTSLVELKELLIGRMKADYNNERSDNQYYITGRKQIARARIYKVEQEIAIIEAFIYQIENFIKVDLYLDKDTTIGYVESQITVPAGLPTLDELYEQALKEVGL
jgi:hypothetical protein